MKVTRYKKANKRINFFVNNFGYHQPIQVLLDGTFCFAAIKVIIFILTKSWFLKTINLFFRTNFLLKSNLKITYNWN